MGEIISLKAPRKKAFRPVLEVFLNSWKNAPHVAYNGA